MTSINNTIGSIAASNPLVGVRLSAASTESSLIAGLNSNAGIGPSDPGFQNLLAAANLQAAYTPAAVFISSDPTSLPQTQPAPATGQQNAFGVDINPIDTMHSSLLEGLGGQFNGSG